jgi:CRISPR-associated protein Csm4
MTKTANDYQELVCVIEPRSAFLTPLQADTLWGMLAWACRWIYGEGELQDFLDLQSDGSPRLLLSDAFPDGYLPRPLRPLTALDIRQAIEQRGIKESDEDYLEALAAAKDWLKQIYLDRQQVFDLLAGATTQTTLLSDSLTKLMNARRTGKFQNPEPEKHPRRHNIIDRLRGGSLRENGLYTSQEMWLHHRWSFYLRTTYDTAWLRPLLDYVADTGFGKRASTGLGRFAVVELRALKSDEQFPAVADADGFLTLSSAYAPAAREMIEGAFYSLHVKRGKLGSAMPTSSPGGFLKYPIAMCRAGSVFPASDPTRRWFGQMLGGVHRERDEIRHYGFAYPVAGKLFD